MRQAMLLLTVIAVMLRITATRSGGTITSSDQVTDDCETINDQNGDPVLLADLPATTVVNMADNPSWRAN
jgi:hypothetical protein